MTFAQGISDITPAQEITRLRNVVKDCSARLSEIRDVVNLAADTPISDTILEILNRPYIWSRGYP